MAPGHSKLSVRNVRAASLQQAHLCFIVNTTMNAPNTAVTQRGLLPHPALPQHKTLSGMDASYRVFSLSFLRGIRGRKTAKMMEAEDDVKGRKKRKEKEGMQV